MHGTRGVIPDNVQNHVFKGGIAIVSMSPPAVVGNINFYRTSDRWLVPNAQYRAVKIRSAGDIGETRMKHAKGSSVQRPQRITTKTLLRPDKLQERLRWSDRGVVKHELGDVQIAPARIVVVDGGPHLSFAFALRLSHSQVSPWYMAR